MPNLSSVHWHFTEAGHGKGAPDGVGAVVKRTADRYVAFGRDIPDMNTFISVAEKECSITIKEVKTSDIAAVDSFIQGKKIIPFKGSMNVHQVLWKKGSTSLFFRKMSCNCHLDIKCKFHIGSLDYSNLDKNGNPKAVPSNQHFTTNSFAVGEWVAVNYEGKLYPGIIKKIVQNVCSISAMMPTSDRGTSFKWPSKEDIFDYDVSEIQRKISHPNPCGRRGSQFWFCDFP